MKMKGGKGSSKGGGYSGGGNNGGGSGSASTPSTINAAVISKHTFKIKPFKSTSQQANIPTIVIDSGSSPLKLQMLSSSSDLQIEQDHQNSKPKVITSNSVDGAIIMKHFVRKPIIQNIREIIMPQRKIVQEIMPVKVITYFFCKVYFRYLEKKVEALF